MLQINVSEETAESIYWALRQARNAPTNDAIRIEVYDKALREFEAARHALTAGAQGASETVSLLDQDVTLPGSFSKANERMAQGVSIPATAQGVQRWEPVPNGEVPNVGNCDRLEVRYATRNGAVTQGLVTTQDRTGFIAVLPPDIRLCRLVDAPGTVDTPAQGVQALSDETLETIESALNVAIVDCMVDNAGDSMAFYERARSEFAAWLKRQRPDATTGTPAQGTNA